MAKEFGEKTIGQGEDFLRLLLQLEGPELCALAKMLNVRLLTDNTDPETKKAIPRDAYDIVDDCIVHFGELDRATRRFIVRYLKKHIKKNRK